MPGRPGRSCLFALQLLPLLALLLPEAVQARDLPLLSVAPQEEGGSVYSLNLQVLAVMTLLSVLPAALMTTTAFTRVLIVLAILRQGLGTQQTPSNQILIGLSLFLTLFIMMPVFSNAWEQGMQPYMAEEISAEQALVAVADPFREFMLAQTRQSDLAMFAELADSPQMNSEADVPFKLLLPAFVTSELKSAFQIGFLILIPFLIIDLVVASVLMSMGMVMLSPLIISLPFKLMLFVLVDGWTLLMGTLASSFAVM